MKKEIYEILGVSLPKGFEHILGRELVKPYLPSNNGSIDACIVYKSLDEIAPHLNSALPHVLNKGEIKEDCMAVKFIPLVKFSNGYRINFGGQKGFSYNKWDRIRATVYEKETILSIPFYRTGHDSDKKPVLPIDHQNVLLVKYLLETAKIVK